MGRGKGEFRKSLWSTVKKHNSKSYQVSGIIQILNDKKALVIVSTAVFFAIGMHKTAYSISMVILDLIKYTKHSFLQSFDADTLSASPSLSFLNLL